MNYVVGLLVLAPTNLLNESLHQLIPAKGRPLFEDEIAPEWSHVYDAIKTMEPPDSMVSRGKYFFLRWRCVEWSVSRYSSKLKNAGAICVFDYVVGETAADEELIDENSPEQDECIFHLRVDNTLRRLENSNCRRYLVGFSHDWSSDYEINAGNIIDYIETMGYVGQ
jgi:hypothetical protein